MDAERIEEIRKHATAMTPFPLSFYYFWYEKDVPELLDEVERLNGRVKELEESIDISLVHLDAASKNIAKANETAKIIQSKLLRYANENILRP